MVTKSRHVHLLMRWQEPPFPIVRNNFDVSSKQGIRFFISNVNSQNTTINTLKLAFCCHNDYPLFSNTLYDRRADLSGFPSQKELSDVQLAKE